MESATPNFEEFAAAGSRLNTIFIGITGNGTLSLYSGFYYAEKLDKYKYVSLLFDRTGYIGVKFYEQDDPEKNLLKITHSKDGKSNGWISANNFFTFYKLDAKKLKGKYTPKAVNTEKWGKVFFIDIKGKI